MLRGFSILIAATSIVASTAGCRRDRQTDEDSTQPVPAPSRLSSALEIKPAYETASLPNDPDDPAIWVHPTDPSRSLMKPKDFRIRTASVRSVLVALKNSRANLTPPARGARPRRRATPRYGVSCPPR